MTILFAHIIIIHFNSLLNVTVCVSSVFAVALISVMILYLKHFYLLYIGSVFLG